MDRILAIDDDVGLTELLTEYLGREGFTLEAVHDGKSGIGKSLSGGYTLIILDIMLPNLGGLEVLRQIRRSSHVPVIMLTARDSITDRVLGLEFGADDYLPKLIADHIHAGDVAILVTDQGPGVPAVELKRLFRPFYRVSKA